MPAPNPNPTGQPPTSARILRYLLWASELGLVLAVLYVMANRAPARPPAGGSPPPAAPSAGAAP